MKTTPRHVLLLVLLCMSVVRGEPPSIVYILADDMGYGDVACLNKEGKIPTPHIDRLAREGKTFTDAHSGSAVCTPTRYGILTGRERPEHTVKNRAYRARIPYNWRLL